MQCIACLSAVQRVGAVQAWVQCSMWAQCTPPSVQRCAETLDGQTQRNPRPSGPEGTQLQAPPGPTGSPASTKQAMPGRQEATKRPYADAPRGAALLVGTTDSGAALG